MKDVQGLFYVNNISKILSVNFHFEYKCATTWLGARLYPFLNPVDCNLFISKFIELRVIFCLL